MKRTKNIKSHRCLLRSLLDMLTLFWEFVGEIVLLAS